MLSDEHWMRKALELAHRAAKRGEVPVGAILIRNDQILAVASNRREQWQSPLGHAELILLQRASQRLQTWRLVDCTMYVTLEPCVMCAGALVQSRIQRVVYGAVDPKGGGMESLYQIGQDPRLNHRIETKRGVLEHDCSEILKNFFKSRRLEKKSQR